MKRNKAITQLILFVGILIVINLISNKLFFRLDFTADKQYTLSSTTKNVLKDVNEVINITAYFTEELPPQLQKSKRDFEDLLIEYENRSGNNIVYNFVNPNKNEEEESKAQQEGISPLSVNVSEKDQVQQLRAYMGAVLTMGDKKEVIPVISPGPGMEYALTTAIKKISVTEKPKIAFLQGHGEPPVNASVEVLQQLSVLYDIEPYTINDTSDIPSYYRTIVLIDPKDTIPARDFARLDKYLSLGGRMYIAYNPLESNIQSQYLGPLPDIGLKGWLAGKGININDKYVIDASCGSVQVREQQSSFLQFTRMISMPFIPIIKKFGDHPTSKGLEAVILPFVAPISFLPKDSAVHYTPLLFTSEKSGIVTPPTAIDINKEWKEADFNAENQVVAMAAEGPISGGGNAKLVVVGSGNFAVNGIGEQQQRVSPDNVNFASNAIDWLSDDTGLIELRTKGVTARLLDDVEDTKRIIYKWTNALLPILLIIMLAFIRKQRYSRKRQAWMQGNY